MNDEMLEIDLRLLILRHGKNRVIQALAKIDESPIEKLQGLLATAESRRRSKKPRPSVMELVDHECREHPEAAGPLRILADSFQSRTFLPQLRDVQRFLERIGAAHRGLRSRNLAAPILFGELSKLAPELLLRLAAENNLGVASDYSLLSQAIMDLPVRDNQGMQETRHDLGRAGVSAASTPPRGNNRFDIPESLKSLTPEKFEFISVLLKADSSGLIVKQVAFLEHLLSRLLTAFSRKSPQQAGLTEATVLRKSLHEKIQILSRLHLDSEGAMLRDRVASGLHTLRDIRNVSAHKAGITSADFDKLYTNVAKRELLANFPANFEAMVREIQGWLQDMESALKI